jgi:hypothetical protein
MSNSKPQNLQNHARFDPPFHFFLAWVFLANVVLSIAALIAVFRIRIYPLKVQDRVIRLEERLRLQALASPEWHAQIYRLTEDQLVALRFAADDEVVELAKQALEHNLSRKQIKQRIKSWRADYWRV